MSVSVHVWFGGDARWLERPRGPTGLCLGLTTRGPEEQGATALGQMCRYLQEVGQEAGVVWWWRRRRGWWRERLLQAVSLGAQSPGHHVGIWLREGGQVHVSHRPVSRSP